MDSSPGHLLQSRKRWATRNQHILNIPEKTTNRLVRRIVEGINSPCDRARKWSTRAKKHRRTYSAGPGEPTTNQGISAIESGSMKRTAGLLLGISYLLSAADKHYWKAGKVLDSEAARTYFQTGSTTVSSESRRVNSSGTSVIAGNTVSSVGHATASASGTQQTYIHNMAIQSTQLLILGDEYAYVVEDSVEKAVGPSLHGTLGRAIRNGKHGCRYVVNDWISYAEEGGKLLINDVDGKTCKLDIVRQERLKPEEILALESPINSPTAPDQKAPPPSTAASTSDVSIKSTPEGADITVDGKYMGSTPSIIRLAVGEHHVEINVPGFKVWKRQMTVASGGQITINAMLEKIVSQ